MAGRLTTHALDQMRGAGAAGLRVTLAGPGLADAIEITLDRDGRGVLLEAGLAPGRYALVFHVADYHRSVGVALSDPPFLDQVTIAFGGRGGRHAPPRAAAAQPLRLQHLSRVMSAPWI